MAKPIINYISGIPGLGKTEWAINKIKACLSNKDEIVLYVAPTKQLLNEVYKRLKHDCDKDELKSVHPLYGANLPFGGVSETIEHFLTGTADKHGVKHKKARRGDVLLMTHQGFISLPVFPRSEELTVIFDESRKCVSEAIPIKFKSLEEQKHLEKCITIQTAVADTSYSLVTSELGSWKKFKNGISKKGFLFSTKEMLRFDKFFQATRNPRIEVYMHFQRKSENNSSLSSFEVIVPSRVFEGFKSVTLLSAFFEDSQMYHLLKQRQANRKLKLVNVTDQVPDWKNRHFQLMNRYRQVTLVPITAQETALSISNQTNIMVDSEHIDLVDKLRDLGITKISEMQRLRPILMKSQRYDLTGKYGKAFDLITKNKEHFAINPIGWQIKESLGVIEKWCFANKTEASNKPLLVLNKKIIDSVPDKYLKKFDLISTHVYGLNTYIDRNIIVFLAAVNPRTTLINLYKIILPEYEFERDHVADVCVQCVCRLSVRNVKAKEGVLVILPDKKIMALLSSRMGEHPDRPTNLWPKRSMVFVDKFAMMNTLGKEKYEAKRKTEKAASQKSHTKKWRESTPTAKKILSINSRLYQIRKKIKENPKDKELLKREAALIAERESLKCK